MKKLWTALFIIGVGALGYWLGTIQSNTQELLVPGEEHIDLVELSLIQVSEGSQNEEVALFLALHQELKAKHQVLKQTRAEVQEIRETFEGKIPLGVRRQLAQNYAQLLGMREAYLATKGLAYQRLVEIKDSYHPDQLDEVIVVYQEVLVVLNQRITLVDQAILLLVESIQLVQNIYQHPGGKLGRLAVVDFPADDLPAEDIDEEVKVEEGPRDGPIPGKARRARRAATSCPGSRPGRALLPRRW